MKATVGVRVNLDRELYEELRAVADERCVGVGLLLNRAVAVYLDLLIPIDEFEDS